MKATSSKAQVKVNMKVTSSKAQVSKENLEILIGYHYKS